MSLKVEAIMTKNLITVEPSATVIEAVEAMSRNEIGCLVVSQADQPMGIITERDVLKRVLLQGRDPTTTKVYEIMSAPLLVGDPEMDVQDAVKLMVTNKIKRLPISRQSQLIGLITLSDLARSIAYLEHIVKSGNVNVG